MEGTSSVSLGLASPSSSNLVVHWVQIPRYMLRGAGSCTHYEYEVRVNMVGEHWSVLRRYKRFRELHMNMKEKYGSQVCVYLELAVLHTFDSINSLAIKLCDVCRQCCVCIM